MRKFLIVAAAVIAVVVLGGAVFVGARQHLKFDPPMPNVTASTDSLIVERGRYIVRDLTSCASCHADAKQRAAYARGEDVPLVGGYEFAVAPGRFYSRNLTSDSATGLGAVSDGAIARALRSGVGHDGRALLPFMEMQGLSDDDLQAVVSYLRTQAPVHNPVPPHQYALLGKIIKATVLANPVGPASPPPSRAPRDLSVATGKYLVESVSLCWACHTQRSKMTGALVGPRFGGAKDFTEVDDPSHSWAPPNITSDAKTGRLGQWTEDQFVARFRQGRILPGSPMPWQSFSRMREDDLRSIYRYLKSVPAVVNDVGPPVTDVKRPS